MTTNRSATEHAVRNADRQLKNYQEQKFCDLIVTALENQNVTVATTSSQNPPSYSDVVSHCDIYCHKMVLSANSPYFDAILSAEFPGDGNSVLEVQLAGTAYGMIVKEPRGRMVKIVLRDVDKEYLKPIIDYMYSGIIDLTFDNLIPVWRNAEKLKVDTLISDCRTFVEQEATTSNCIKLIVCAKEMGRQANESNAFNFFLNNISRVCQVSAGDVRRLPLTVMTAMMNSDRLNAQNAEAAFKLLITWVDSDRIDRSQHLHSLMEPKIRLLSSEFLLQVLGSKEVVSSSATLMRLIMTTLQFKQLAIHSTSASFPTSPVSSVSPNPVSGQSNQLEQDTLLVLTSVFKEKGNGVHEKFDPDSNTWSEWTTKDMGDGYGVVVIGEWMGVIGGLTPNQYKRNVEMHNLKTKEWRAGPQMIKPRSYFGCCVTNEDTIIVCGGITTNNKEFAECEMLKLNRDETGTWEQLPSMTIKRGSCSAATIKNKTFVIGGFLVNDDKTRTVYSIVEEFDVTTKQWRTRSSMNEARRNFAIATHQNKIYVFGGWRDMKTLTSCERYDPSTDKWQYICNLPSPRNANTAALIGNRIYIIGGGSEGKWTKTTHFYDIENDIYSEGPNLNNAAYWPKCVVVKKYFLFN